MTVFGMILEAVAGTKVSARAAVAGRLYEVFQPTCDARMQGSLGGRFPECLEEIVLGRVREKIDGEKRDAAIIRTVLKRVLIALKRLHSLGGDLYTMHSHRLLELLLRAWRVYVLQSTGRLHHILSHHHIDAAFSEKSGLRGCFSQ